MQRAIRLGLVLSAALAFTPAFAAFPGSRHIGGDNSDESMPPVEETQVRTTQPDDMSQATAPDQKDQSYSAGAASGEPDRYEFQDREEHGHGYK